MKHFNHHPPPLRRGDVVPRRPLHLVGDIEVLSDLFIGSGQPESAAHGEEDCIAT
jgi:hypothetical protein